MKLSELMTPNPRTAKPTETIDQVAQMMRDEDVGSIPVVDNDDHLVGIITDRDITIQVVAKGLDPKQELVSDYMTADPVTGPPDMSDHEALELMGREQIRRLPVVEGGRLVGIVALGDLALDAEREDEVEEALEEISEPTH